MPKCLLDGVNAIVLYRGSGQDAYSMVVPLEKTKPDKVELDVIEVPSGAKTVKLTGKQLELINLTGTIYMGSILPANLAADESYVEITLPERC